MGNFYFATRVFEMDSLVVAFHTTFEVTASPMRNIFLRKIKTDFRAFFKMTFVLYTLLPLMLGINLGYVT